MHAYIYTYMYIPITHIVSLPIVGTKPLHQPRENILYLYVIWYNDFIKEPPYFCCCIIINSIGQVKMVGNKPPNAEEVSSLALRLFLKYAPPFSINNFWKKPRNVYMSMYIFKRN